MFYLFVLISVIFFLFIWKMRKRCIREKELLLQQKKDEEVHKFEEEFWKMAEERKRLYLLNGGVDIENKTVFDFTNDSELLKRTITYAFKSPNSSSNSYYESSNMSIEELYKWNKTATKWERLNILMAFAEITDNNKIKDAIIFERKLFDEYCVEMFNRFRIIVN